MYFIRKKQLCLISNMSVCVWRKRETEIYLKFILMYSREGDKDNPRSGPQQLLSLKKDKDF